MAAFSNPESVARYAEGPLRQVPGFLALQTMTHLLLAERIGDEACVLVVGAGGGLELKVFAQGHSAWRFCGVDPSAEMLALATRTLGSLSSRVQLHEGYADSAPFGPFDAATCLLTLHFIPQEERLRTLKEIYLRLKPGAPLVVAHHSIPNEKDEKLKWLKRYAAFAAASGVVFANVENQIAAISERLPTLSPEQDEALLRAAGFVGVELFYAAFTFKGWVAYKP